MRLSSLILPLLVAFHVASAELPPDSLPTFPEFKCADAQGENWNLESLLGQYTLVDFWASWCEPCKESFPWMSQLSSDLTEQGFQVVAINLDRKRKKADAFMKERDLPFTVLFDTGGKLASILELKAMPSSFLLDPEGNILFRETGWTEEKAKELEAQIRFHLSQGESK